MKRKLSFKAKMSDMKALVTKKTRRAKARLMQNFGKADKTTDELFEVYQSNFNRQQSTALNLQKHVKHYVHCLKELHDASKALGQCLLDLHERDWPKHDVYENNAYELDHINEDLEEKLKESVLAPLEQYLGQFAEIREKIAKRGRKLVDYDSQRHTFEAISKQHDDSKLNKYRDQLDEARKVYESLNNELHEELPTLYDNRLPLIITVFQRLFSSKVTYYNDNLGIERSYLDTVEILAKATENSTPSGHSPIKSSQPSNGNTGDCHKSEDASVSPAINNIGGSTLALKYLHKVRATYRYLAEDEDELSFDAGEIIQVIEYDDPQEQEEGWLMGIKESNGQKGLFPANFTKEI